MGDPTGWLDVFGLARTRYENNLTNERVQYLRDRTPSDDRRREVNDGVTLPMDDFALPGLKITSILQADHIVPFAKIISLPGFDKLTLEQQLEIVNFKGLSETANKSKNSQTYAEWNKYKKGNIDVDSGFKKTMMEREIKLESQIQNKINEFNANNK